MAAVAKSYTPPSSVAERYPHRQTSLESLSSSSFVDWVNQWGDDDVARWLQENRMTQYAPVFRDNDIRGSVILDVDQQALKEMNISSVGDRVKIVVAIKKLRTACATSRNSMLSRASSNASLNTSYQASGNNYQVKRQNSTKGTGRVPPPLHLDHYRYQSQTQTTASSSSSSLLSAHPKSSSVGTVSPSATSPAHHIRRASSPRQPPPVPAPKAQLPVPPSSASQDLPRSRTPNTLHMPLGQATRSTKYTQPGNSVPSLNVSKSSTSASRSHRKTDSNSHPSVRPSTAGPSYTQPLNLSHHPYATNISPTLDNFDLPPSRPGTAPQPTSKTMGLGGAGLPSINEAPSSHTEHVRSSSHSDKNGFSVGKGAFARPSTSAGTLSVNSTTGAVVHSSPSNFASVEELMRKTVKFESDEDGATKLVNVENLGGDVVELLRRVLKKFGKLQSNPQLARARDGDLTYSQLDGWAIFAATADGNGRWLADSDLFNICQSIHRTERQRGLLLRCVDRKRTSSKREQSGNSSTSPTSPTYLLDVRLPATSIEPASPTPSSPGGSPRGVTSDTGHDQGKRNTLHRASTVSVMSGLLDWNTVSASAQVRPPSLGGALSSGTTRLRNFFGHRPPSELISSHLAEYFPSAEKKLLNKTIRNSVRKSMAMRPKSTASNWDANSSRFSISSAGSSIVGVEPPPPLPAKDHYAAMPLNHENSRWSRIPVNDSSSSFEEEPEADNLPRDSQFASDSLDDESLGVRRTKSRQSQSSRMSSRLSIRTTRSTGRDSDNASLLTVDEITAEVENRRMSMASNWAAPSPAINVADENGVGVRDDMSRSSRSSTSSLQDTLEEEDEEDTEDDEDFEEDDAAPEKVTSTAKQQIKWIKGALIGAGSFGQVFLAMDAMNGALMAVKQVEIPTGTSHNESRKKSMLDALQREIDLLKGLQHPNIVEYLDSSSDGKHLNIFLEYVPGGSVVALLRNYGSFEEPLVRNFVRQIVFGLNYLHERDIVHRDIKGANILVDNKGLIKISDFGISKRVEDNLLSGVKIHRPSLQGSVFWMAPEVVKQTSYTSKADIWSLGCVTIEMLTGNHPHVNLNQMQALFKIGTASAAPDMPPDVSQECVNFLQATFLQDYSARPSAAELLQSPFMAITADSLNSTLSQKTPTASTFPV